MHVPEFPGTSPDDPPAIRQVVDWSDLVLAYQEVIGQLGLQRPVLVGASFGGMLAADLAAVSPNCRAGWYCWPHSGCGSTKPPSSTGTP
nr:alpha/beta hydrolase [Salinispora arenicola]